MIACGPARATVRSTAQCKARRLVTLFVAACVWQNLGKVGVVIVEGNVGSIGGNKLSDYLLGGQHPAILRFGTSAKPTNLTVKCVAE